MAEEFDEYDPDPQWRKSGRSHSLDNFPHPARAGIYANQLPSAPKDHAPRIEDFPRGWTAQQPWYHPAYPVPTETRCVLCGDVHQKGECDVTALLVSLVGATHP